MGVGEAHRTIEFAGGVDLGQTWADMLLVLRAKTVTQGPAVFDYGSELQCDGFGLVGLEESTYISASELMMPSN